MNSTASPLTCFRTASTLCSVGDRQGLQSAFTAIDPEQRNQPTLASLPVFPSRAQSPPCLSIFAATSPAKQCPSFLNIIIHRFYRTVSQSITCITTRFHKVYAHGFVSDLPLSCQCYNLRGWPPGTKDEINYTKASRSAMCS